VYLYEGAVVADGSEEETAASPDVDAFAVASVDIPFGDRHPPGGIRDGRARTTGAWVAAGLV
jgi:hypothetical protein